MRNDHTACVPCAEVANESVPVAQRGFQAFLVPADVAGPMCGRSEASWWRDHAAGRIPAPIKLGGSTLWSVEELRRWIAHSCPPRKTWEAIKRANGGEA
jgi:predicted DNA-binding transcriptional regulator AlpA